MISNRPMEQGIPDEGDAHLEFEAGAGLADEAEARLDQMFLAYREACPDPDASANFMPAIWAKIEAREVSTNWFGRVAKALVTAAITASVILGMMLSARNQSNAFLNDTFVEALRADHASSLEPLHLDRISDLESQ